MYTLFEQGYPVRSDATSSNEIQTQIANGSLTNPRTSVMDLPQYSQIIQLNNPLEREMQFNWGSEEGLMKGFDGCGI